MEKSKFEVTINASPESVWTVLWGDDTYPQWTAAFSPDSRAETDWKKGSKVLFLDASNQGMVSRIAENIPYKFLSIEHLGEVRNGVEDTESERVKAWAGAHENYTLEEIDGQTLLVIDMDINDEFAAMFNEIWPKALAKVKEIAEG